jgi:NADP-dependent 3-hydroxy acid dehydrogenase YdfG
MINNKAITNYFEKLFMNAFKNKVAVITGAASGIGKAIAKKCLEQEINVVLADIDKNKLEMCQNELKKIKNAKIISTVIDVGNEADIIKLSEVSLAEYGSVDFLFNNAGIAGGLGPIWIQPTAVIEEVLRVNLLGTIHGIRTFVPIMLNQNNECFIINTCAGAGLLAGQGLSAYKASKHAITAISEVLFADLKQINASINVSILIPHWVNTDMPNSLNADSNIINDHLNYLKNFGISPDVVAEKVFAGIKAKMFYIFTDPEQHIPKIKKRMESILLLQDPC